MNHSTRNRSKEAPTTKGSTQHSTFSRLSSGFAAAGGHTAPRWAATPEGVTVDPGCGDAGCCNSLNSLAGVVAAVRESAQAVDQVRSAFEEVCHENRTASRLATWQVESLSVTSDSWSQFRAAFHSPTQSTLTCGPTAASQRLLG